MNKKRVVLVVLAGLLGLVLGHVSGAWGFEQEATYRLPANVLLIATLLVALMRPPAGIGTSSGRGRVEPLMLVVSLVFGAALLATYVGSRASDANPARYLIVAAAFVPLAVVKRSTHRWWNAAAPMIVLAFVPALTHAALLVAEDVNVWLSPIVFMVPTMVILLFSHYLPTLSDERHGRAETGLAMTAAFLMGVTLVSSSYNYDMWPAVIIGVTMTVVGWLLGVALRRWDYAPSRVLTWQNLVIGVWIGQFMPGAAVMTAIALVAGWAFYGTMHGISVAVRKGRERRENATA